MLSGKGVLFSASVLMRMTVAAAQTAYPILGTAPALTGHPGCPGVDVSHIPAGATWQANLVPGGVNIIPSVEFVHHNAPPGVMCSSTYGKDPAGSDQAGNAAILPITAVDPTGTTSQCLDIYMPAGAVNPPLIIYAHGGGWSLNHRTTPFVQREATWIAQNTGFAVAVFDYRLAQAGKTTNRFPAGIQDARCAVRWLKYNAGVFGYDATRIGLYGGSTGGTIVDMLATQMDQDPSLYGPPQTALTLANDQAPAPLDSPDCGDTISPGFDLNAAEDLSVQAAVSLFGPSNFTLERSYHDLDSATQLAGMVNRTMVQISYDIMAIGKQGTHGTYQEFTSYPVKTINAKLEFAVTNYLIEGAVNAADAQAVGEAHPFFQVLRNGVGIDVPPMFLTHGSADVTVPPSHSADMFNALTGVFTLGAPHTVAYANQTAEVTVGTGPAKCVSADGPATPCDTHLYQGGVQLPSQTVSAPNTINGNPVTFTYVPHLAHGFGLFSSIMGQNPDWSTASCNAFTLYDTYLKAPASSD